VIHLTRFSYDVPFPKTQLEVICLYASLQCQLVKPAWKVKSAVQECVAKTCKNQIKQRTKKAKDRIKTLGDAMIGISKFRASIWAVQGWTYK